MTHLPPQISQACPTIVQSFTEGGINKAVLPLATAAGQHPARAVVVVGGQVGSTRTVNVALVDALQRPVIGSHLLLVWVATTEGGAAGGSQTLAVTKGVLVKELDAGKVAVVMSDTDGKAAIEMDGAAGSRWVGVSVLGGVWGADAALI